MPSRHDTEDQTQPTGAAGYLAAAREAVDRVAEQHSAICRAGSMVAQALSKGHRVLAFGTGHSHMIAEEVYTRAGGLASVHAVLEPSLMLHESPSKSSALERLPGYARILVDEAGVARGDVVLVASNSGRNAVPVEFAEESRARGATVIAVTSRAMSGAVSPRAPSGNRLMEIADLVLDNVSPLGDAAVAMPGRPHRVGALSTVTGALLVQAVTAEAATLLAADGHDLEVLVSYNADAGKPASESTPPQFD